jgi:hypothetical protein
MNEKILELFEKFVPKNYVQQANQSLITNDNEIKKLITHVNFNVLYF